MVTRWALVIAGSTPPSFADINETIVVDAIDRHGDFIGVAGEHQSRRTALVQDGDGVAMGSVKVSSA